MKVLFKNFIKILIFIHIIPNSLAQWCHIRYNNNWLHEWRLIVYRDNNNRYQLLRGSRVPVNNEILLLCNGQPRQEIVRCNANQRFNPNLPLRHNCREDDSIMSESILFPNVDYCRYSLYRIGFRITINEREHFLETYQVCFDERHLRPLFTINRAFPVGVRRLQSLQFDPDNFFHGDYFHAFDRENTFLRFRHLLGNNQRYMDPDNLDHVIDRGHLTPSADFTLTNFKSSTFKMMNAVPQFKTIDNGNWRRIEEWARDITRTPTHVCTGVLDCNLDGNMPADLSCVLKLQNNRLRWIPMFLANGHRIPIPLWIYKIVKFQGNAIVFLTLNNIYYERVNPDGSREAECPVRLNPNMCLAVECPMDLDLHQNVAEGCTYCCGYNEFITNRVPYLRNVC